MYTTKPKMTMEQLNELNKHRELVKLDIGAGGYSGDDTFLSVDGFTEADIQSMMWDIPIPSESVDTIYCSQALEHISKFQVIPTLQEWARVLKSEGKLLVSVPDFEWACMWWLMHQTTEWDMDIIYGNQTHDGQYHKTGFTSDILSMYFSLVPELEIKNMWTDGGSSSLKFVKETSEVQEDRYQRIIYVEAQKL